MSAAPYRSQAHRAIHRALSALSGTAEVAKFLGRTWKVDVSHPLEIMTFQVLPIGREDLRANAVHFGWRYLLHVGGRLALADVLEREDERTKLRRLVTGPAAARVGRKLRAAARMPGKRDLVALDLPSLRIYAVWARDKVTSRDRFVFLTEGRRRRVRTATTAGFLKVIADRSAAVQAGTAPG
jgi:hypothetical protein